MSTERLFKCDTSAKNESAFHTCIMRISSHHKALYCYILLSVWIFLLVAGMYKYIGIEDGSSIHLDNEVEEYPRLSKYDMKMRRVMKICNPPSQITAGSEGKVEGNHSLEGVLVFLRHGDRGPMSHVRNISGVHCDGDLLDTSSLAANPYYPTFKAFIQNLSGGVPGRAPGADRFLGNFNDFPLHPALSGECQLGQLTPVGLSQILTIGHVLKEAYAERLGVGNGTLSRENTRLYTTRYRRTVQSAIAFLTSFLSPEDILRTSLHESYSVSFCFDDCACPAAERYSHNFAKERAEHFRAHPAVMELVQNAAPIVYDILSTPLLNDPHSLRDAFLTYVCHGAPLPCAELPPGGETCIRMDQVTGLFAYTEWEAKQYAKSTALKKSCLLRAYGVLRNVVTHMLNIVSEKRPKFVLYSGHDMTLQYLTTALGVLGETSATPYYASRLVLEVYRDTEVSDVSRRTSPREYYFRLVYNGRDLTNHIAFCRGKEGHVTLTHDEQADKTQRIQTQAYLCPIESIIRFLHDDYFTSFNATNFKDACAVRS